MSFSHWLRAIVWDDARGRVKPLKSCTQQAHRGDKMVISCRPAWLRLLTYTSPSWFTTWSLSWDSSALTLINFFRLFGKTLTQKLLKLFQTSTLLYQKQTDVTHQNSILIIGWFLKMKDIKNYSPLFWTHKLLVADHEEG